MCTVQADDETDGKIDKANGWMRMNDGCVIWNLINGNDKRRQNANNQWIYLFISSGERISKSVRAERRSLVLSKRMGKRFYRLLLCFPGCAGAESIVHICIWVWIWVWVFRLFSIHCSLCAHHVYDFLRHQCDNALKFNMKINLLTKVERPG